MGDSDSVTHVLDVKPSSSPTASQPNAPDITESETATRPSSSDEVQGNSSYAGEPPLLSEGKLSERVRQRIISWYYRNRDLTTCDTTVRTLLDSKAIKGGPYSDLQLLWFRKKSAWPLPSETPTWPPREKKELEELVGLADEFWSSEQKDRVKRLDSLNADASSGRNELYQVVGLYAVFLSVFFSSASQTNNLKCHDWPILVILTLVVTVYTSVIFYQKSGLNYALKGRITRLNEIHKHIESQITKLRQSGPSFDFKAEDIKIEDNSANLFQTYFKPISDLFSGIDTDKYIGLIAIESFTFFICIGIYYVLCWRGKTLENKRLSTWASLGL